MFVSLVSTRIYEHGSVLWCHVIFFSWQYDWRPLLVTLFEFLPHIFIWKALVLINLPLRSAAHHTVCILGEPLQREQRVVRLNNYVAHLILVREHRVSLYQFLWVPVEREIFCLHTLDHKLSEQAKSLFVDLSLSFSSRYDPSPEPVPPAIEWHKTNPYEDTRVTYNSACATCVRSSQQTPLVHRRKVCGWVNVLLPRQLYKW